MVFKRKATKAKATKRTSKKTTTKKTTKRPTIDAAALNHMVSERAYYVWEEWGKPQGRDVDIWAQAEKDIKIMAKKR